MLTFIFVVIGIIFILGVIITINDGVKAENNKEELYKNISDIPYTKHFVSEDGKRSIMLDDESKDIHLYDANNIKQINYKDILQVEVMEDSKSITQTSRGSQAAGTILGGLALGGAGAIIGGVTADKKHANKVKTIGLRIVANDTNNPIHEFQIIDFERYASTEEREYKENYNIAFEWYKTIEVLIHQADKEDEVNVKEG